MSCRLVLETFPAILIDAAGHIVYLRAAEIPASLDIGDSPQVHMCHSRHHVDFTVVVEFRR